MTEMTDLALVHGAPAAPRGFVSRATRWMGLAFLAAGLLAGSNGVLAANADLKVTVTPIPNVTSADGTVSSAVSLSRITDTSVFNAYLALQVTVTNSVPNTNNAVVFSSPVNVDPGAPPPGAPTVVGTACIAGSTFTNTQITCNIGQMQGGTSVSFVVIFRTPTNGTKIDFPWTLSYSTPGSQGSTPSGTDFSGDVSAALITAPPEDVSTKFTTYVPPGQSSAFFTGNRNGTALSTTAADKLTAKVIVPSTSVGLSTLSVLNDPSATGGLTNDTLTTNTTHIQAPYTKLGASALFDEPIFIEMRRDSTTIRSFNQIGRAVIYYKSEPGEFYQTTGTNGDQLSDCDSNGMYTTMVPLCIYKRYPLSKKWQVDPDYPIPTPTADDLGDWLIVVKAWQNGIARW